MKLRELLPNIESKLNNIEITGMTCNSKEVQTGFAFICINGTNLDGHKFAKSAVENGAVVIVSERDLGLANQIVVDDTHAVSPTIRHTFPEDIASAPILIMPPSRKTRLPPLSSNELPEPSLPTVIE